MNTIAKSLVMGCVMVSLAAVSAMGQQKTSTTDTSLGDLARQLNAQKASGPKPLKVFTNDNLVSPEDEAAAFNSSSKDKKPATTAPEAPKAQAHDETYYRSQLRSLKDKLDTDQRELDVLQQKLGQNQMQQYGNDPNKSLTQQYSREDINKLTADIDAKKQVVDDDNQAIEDQRNQLRQEGGDPGWLR